MDQQKLGEGGLQHVTRLPGGTQNILMAFSRAGRHYVLRRPPVMLRRNSNDTMRREARVLAALAETDVPHPKLIAACEDERVLGAAFYLMEPVDGYNAAQGLPEPFASSPELRWSMGLSMVDGLIALEQVDHDALGLSDFGRADLYLERQVARWRAQLESYADSPEWDGLQDLVGVGRIGAWLDANRPLEYRPGLMHGDYHLANVMFRYDAPKLAAIVDWELTTIGDPLLDLGWLMATWPERVDAFGVGAVGVTPWDGFPAIDDVITHYTDSATRDTTAIEWYGVLACFKLAIVQEGTYARARAGKVPMEIGQHLHERSVWLLKRALQWIS